MNNPEASNEKPESVKTEEMDVVNSLPRLSEASKKWDVENKGFLTEEQKMLRKLDTSGAGALTADQLSSFANQFRDLRNENKQIKNGIFILACLAILFFVGTVTASILAAQYNKELQTAQSVLVSTDGQPVSTNVNTAFLPLAALAFLSADMVQKVDQLYIMGGEESEESYYFTVGSIRVTDGESVTIQTLTSDTIAWPGMDEDGNEDASIITMTLSDGTVWNKSAVCKQCAATSLVMSEEDVTDVIDSLNSKVASGRRLGGYNGAFVLNKGNNADGSWYCTLFCLDDGDYISTGEPTLSFVANSNNFHFRCNGEYDTQEYEDCFGEPAPSNGVVRDAVDCGNGHFGALQFNSAGRFSFDCSTTGNC